MTRRVTHERQLTLRFDAELARRLKRVAERDAVSLNQAAVGLLRRAVGMATATPQRPEASWIAKHAGTWTRAEAEAFDRAVAVFEVIDPEAWDVPAVPARKRRR